MKYDVDGMLAKFDLSQEEKSLFRKLIFDSPLWKDGDRGYSNRDVIFCDTLRLLSEKLRKVFFSLVARYDFEMEFMPFNEGIDELIKELKDNGYRIYLLSNIGLNFHIFNLKIPVFGMFDGLFPSCDFGVLKPEKEIYKLFFERLSLEPGECLFIDDSPENVEASIKAGMPAILYNAVYENVDELRKKLREREIII